MAAIAAEILRVISPTLGKTHEVAREEASEWMGDFLLIAGLSKKRMAAMAGILRQTLTFTHGLDLVSKETASVTNSFAEAIDTGVWIFACAKQQRMPALLASVFVDSVPLPGFHVGVAHEEAGEDMPDSCLAGIFRKEVFTAAAYSGAARDASAVVFHLMSE